MLLRDHEKEGKQFPELYHNSCIEPGSSSLPLATCLRACTHYISMSVPVTVRNVSYVRVLYFFERYIRTLTYSDPRAMVYSPL